MKRKIFAINYFLVGSLCDSEDRRGGEGGGGKDFFEVGWLAKMKKRLHFFLLPKKGLNMETEGAERSTYMGESA